MKYIDVKNMPEKELKDVLAKNKAQLVDLQFKAHSGTLKQVHSIRQVKKDIARILTRLSEYGKDSKKQ